MLRPSPSLMAFASPIGTSLNAATCIHCDCCLAITISISGTVTEIPKLTIGYFGDCPRILERPLPDDASHLYEYVLLARAGALERAEAVVGGVQDVECRAFAKFSADGLEKFHVRQLVARAAKE